MFIQINIDYKINTAIIKEKKAINVFVIENVSLKSKIQMRNSNIDIDNYPWIFILVRRTFEGYNSRWMIRCTNNFISFFRSQTWDSINIRSQWLLDKDNIKLFFIF